MASTRKVAHGASKASPRRSDRKVPVPLILDAPVTAERSLPSARTRSTPRPSPHPTPTPRAPRAVRTPKGPGEPLVQVRSRFASLASRRATECWPSPPGSRAQGFPAFNAEAIRTAEVRQLALSARGDAAAC